MTLPPDDLKLTAAPQLEAEMATRLNDPDHGQAERIRLRLHLQNLQAQLRAQAESGLPVATYAQLQAARQAVESALNILSKVSAGFSDPDAGMAAGPIPSSVFFKR